MVKKRLMYSAFPDVICEECDGCQKRQEGCHSSCEDYVKASLAIELLRIELRKEQDVKCDTRSYLVEQHSSKIKHKHPSTRYGKVGKRR